MKENNLFFLIILFTTNIVLGQSILNTVHNLSVSGPGTTKAISESEICIFCHTPHNSSPRKPLWNRNDPGSYYTLYNSSTSNANPGQPDGSSILCLSCHDGTIAIGNVLSRSSDIAIRGIPTVHGPANLSTDLSNDHPVSFIYNSSLTSTDGELKNPNTLTGPVYLENGKLQCTSCHDPHLNIYDNFLVASRQQSTLCLYCHDKNGWNSSSHKTSNKTWNGSGTDPWPNSNYTTVSQNACENCHTPHNAGGAVRLMKYYREEDNCLDCHNGNVASTNIERDITQQWKHNVFPYSNIHDPLETIPVQNRHVECVDCHNPHMVNASGATAPYANGFIQGVPGEDSNGNPVSSIQYQYELCYKCHAESPDKPGTNIPRQIQQTNVRLEFDLSNPSFHPVEGPGKNNNVPSLISPYTESSIIYCTDCHASSGADAAKGPHGSIYFHLLKYNYETADNTPESYQAYELCYQCHDRNTIIGTGGMGGGGGMRNIHKIHVRKENTPCSACHDSHGISSSQGNSTNNSHLINFNVSIVGFSNGRREYIDKGNSRGSCYLYCHGENHNPKSY